MGRTVAELEVQLDPEEFAEWCAYFDLKHEQLEAKTATLKAAGAKPKRQAKLGTK